MLVEYINVNIIWEWFITSITLKINTCVPIVHNPGVALFLIQDSADDIFYQDDISDLWKTKFEILFTIYSAQHMISITLEGGVVGRKMLLSS